ncbi:glycerol-3-phosphate 1-O-acyltransferase PlsY [Singulisphaera sp. PoT]|uniref:glycerol-3-phosphate 1-O-acyltransferase PlsY n=1 Tax=Singulisphaera sp. PoT TaxID=3411797 RepID=UPI003BF59713
MSPNAWAVGSVILAYLIGALPFGYLIARWLRGIDIRTVGSGNIGATNVGRVLGFRFFVLVFTLDLLKGFLPTYLFPKGVAAYTEGTFPDLGVAVALATIMGHNFPVYLKFKGGKGVATSLGALLALDWMASVASAVGFGLSLRLTRYVSLSSMLGSLVFLATYLLRVGDPFQREHRAMTIVTFGLVILLFARHRKNIVRLREGTEPKVSFRRSREQPSGHVTRIVMVAIASIAIALVVILTAPARRPTELTVGRFELKEVDRVGTGHQRADRVTFANNGKLVAVSCPRYNRVVLFELTKRMELEEVRDIELAGRPVAICATRDRLYVLERPSGDQRHVEPGWWETFDFRGEPMGERQMAGMYPDDLVVSSDARHVFVISSGRAEGDAKRPMPALEVFNVEKERPKLVSRLEFDKSGDDPARFALSKSGLVGAVTLLGTNQLAAIDLTDLTRPKQVGRSDIQEDHVPRFSTIDGDSILMGLGPETEATLVTSPVVHDFPSGWIACAMPNEASLILYEADTQKSLGSIPLRAGGLNLTRTRPTAVDFDPNQGLLAVANRSGGVHIITIKESGGHREALQDAGVSRASTTTTK